MTSKSAQLQLHTILEMRMKDAFADMTVFSALVEQAKLADPARVVVPDYVKEAVSVSEVITENGTRCVVLEPHEAQESAPQLIYYHGGGFIIEIDGDHWDFVLALIKMMGCRVIVPLYPLAPNVTYREGCEAAYSAFEHFDRSDEGQDRSTIVVGDSAGGNLAITVCQMALLRGHRVPAACIALSPWLDVRMESDAKALKDTLDPVLATMGVKKAGELWIPDKTETVEYGLPLQGPFEGLPPTAIITGSLELLLEDSLDFTWLASCAGTEVLLKVYPGLWHDFPLMVDIDEAQEALRDIVSFIDGLSR